MSHSSQKPARPSRITEMNGDDYRRLLREGQITHCIRKVTTPMYHGEDIRIDDRAPSLNNGPAFHAHLVEALEFLTEATLTRADPDYMHRALVRACKALSVANPGWTPPVPFEGYP